MRVGALVLGFQLLALSALSACGGLSTSRTASQPSPSPEAPVYYVDGATPSPGLNEAPDMPSDKYLEGCVPWSRDRPDLYVCGPVADSFTPAPPPGDYADYPAACELAASIFQEWAPTLMANDGLSTLPVIDVASCGATGLGSAQEGRWMAKFALANAQDVSPYRSAVVRGFTLDAIQTERPVAVFLSEAPWGTDQG